MSQSRKKVKKLQKQRHQKRQETVQRRERAVQERSRPVHDEVNDELIDDMLPLLSRFGGLASGSKPDFKKLMLTIMDTDDLADTPEMEGILFDPVQAIDTYEEIVQKMGLSPEKMESLPTEEREDNQLEIQEKCVKRLLTAEIRQDILQRLDNLRLRLKRSGKKKDTARVAALLTFLQDDKKGANWPMIGLAQGIVRRHINIGFDLMDLAMTAGPDFDEDADIFAGKTPKKPGLLKKFKTLLKTPGLNDYLEKQVDKTWQEGTDALFRGDLYLNIYLNEELDNAYEIIAKVHGFENAEAMSAAEPAKKLSDEQAKEMIGSFINYVTTIFTPTRLKQLRGRIDTLTKDPQYKEKWLPFLTMLKSHLANKDAVEYEMKFFVTALFGEIQVKAQEESR